MKFYSLLGLCKRASKVAGGEVAAEEAIRGKKACLVIVAGDVRRQNTKKKFHNSASFYEAPDFGTGNKGRFRQSCRRGNPRGTGCDRSGICGKTAAACADSRKRRVKDLE